MISKIQWIEALESGEHQQARGLLAMENRTCCLGVIGKLTGMRQGGLDLGRTHSCMYMTDGEVELDSNAIHTLVPGMTLSDSDFAQELNDHQAQSFRQIAEAFRERWDLPKETV